jgi:E3 ubiquitin-protein ligase SHPRH
MLDITEHALAENGVSFVRATSLRHMGSKAEIVRQKECTMLLLNVKNGAEALTLLEATHVFMLEPFLNNGLDGQAINGFTASAKTRKHMCMIKDTIEMKIKMLRVEQQQQHQQIEDTILYKGKKSLFHSLH